MYFWELAQAVRLGVIDDVNVILGITNFSKF